MVVAVGVVCKGSSLEFKDHDVICNIHKVLHNDYVVQFAEIHVI